MEIAMSRGDEATVRVLQEHSVRLQCAAAEAASALLAEEEAVGSLTELPSKSSRRRDRKRRSKREQGERHG